MNEKAYKGLNDSCVHYLSVIPSVSGEGDQGHGTQENRFIHEGSSGFGWKFLPLLRLLPRMTAKRKILLLKLCLHLIPASEELMDFAIASHFLGLRFHHRLASFLKGHSLVVCH
jgi:hypothetical protein